MLKKTFLFILAGLFFILPASQAPAQEPTTEDLRNYQIEVKQFENDLKMYLDQQTRPARSGAELKVFEKKLLSEEKKQQPHQGHPPGQGGPESPGAGLGQFHCRARIRARGRTRAHHQARSQMGNVRFQVLCAAQAVRKSLVHENAVRIGPPAEARNYRIVINAGGEPPPAPPISFTA